jgi:hypothetical protein
MRIYVDESYPQRYGAGVSAGIEKAYETRGSDATRGRACPCEFGDEALHRGFKAGWNAVRKVAG